MMSLTIATHMSTKVRRIQDPNKTPKSNIPPEKMIEVVS
jgi:hypothetical protein